MAAGSLLVTEAGGLVGNLTGEADFMDQGECLAANPRIYGQLISILSKYSKFAGAGDKASVRQVLQDGNGAPGDADETVSDSAEAAPVPAEKTTLKAKRIKATPGAAAPKPPAAS